MSNTLKQKAYDYLREGLLSGRLPNGSRLSPAQIASELGTSHIPVREAISQLQSEGLVEQVPRLGAFVKALDRREAFELLDVRQALECCAVAKAARRVTAMQVEELETHCRALARLAGLAAKGKIKKPADIATQWATADLALHMVLLRAAGNQRLMKMICDARLMTRLFAYTFNAGQTMEQLASNYRENYRVHRELVDAVKRKDPKAARKAMNLHMRRGRENLRTLFDFLESSQMSAISRQDSPASVPGAKDKSSSTNRTSSKPA